MFISCLVVHTAWKLSVTVSFILHALWVDTRMHIHTHACTRTHAHIMEILTLKPETGFHYIYALLIRNSNNVITVRTRKLSLLPFYPP